MSQTAHAGLFLIDIFHRQDCLPDIYNNCFIISHSNHWNMLYSIRYTELFEMIVRVLATCHTQYTWDRSICIFSFNRTTLQVFVKYLTGALYVHPLWFYKHQHDNQVHSKLSVACQWWWFQWRFWFVPSIPGYLQEEEEHKPDPWRNPIERNHMGLHLENEVARQVVSDHHGVDVCRITKGAHIEHL